MFSGRRKRLIVLVGIIVLALLLSGLATGEIGAKLLRGGEAEGIVPQPRLHLPPQPVLPEEAREQFLDFEEQEAESPFEPMKFFVSNTMLSAWLTSLVLIAVFVIGARRPRLVPRGLQNLCEMVIEALLNFVEGVVGKEWGHRLLPVIATIFLFVFFNALMALLPIYPALGFLQDGHIEVYLFRSAATDVNMPLALALVSFGFVEFCGLRAFGVSYLGKFIRVRELLKGRPLGIVDAFIGILEAFSEFMRTLSFTFRLFGNMTAGEVLVVVITFLVPLVATVAVYGLEILIGFVQALIFAGLTLVFASAALAPHGAEGPAEAAG